MLLNSDSTHEEPESPHANVADVPRILVLLATHNGARFLRDQLDSILQQEDVDVAIVVSDDGSSDDTNAILQSVGDGAPVSVLPPVRSYGAAPNFFRLIRSVDVSAYDAISFADQDDIWEPQKLRRHWNLLRSGYDAVSSNVEAFTASGRTALIKKDYPLRRYDYLLESGGPGSTFLLRRNTFALVQRIIANDSRVASVQAHDWLVYAIVRAAGQSWHIDAWPSVRYRQHDANVVGANRGAIAALRRMRNLLNGWHREQSTRIGRIVQDCAANDEATNIRTIIDAMSGPRTQRRKLMHAASNLRRNQREARTIRLLLLLGMW